MSFAQELSNLKLEAMKKLVAENEQGYPEIIAIFNHYIDKLISLPYHEVPGWKELESP